MPSQSKNTYVRRLHLALFAIAVLLAFSLSQPLAARAHSGTVSPQEARTAALAWLRTCPAFAGDRYTPAPAVLEIKDEAQSETVAYVLELQPEGFIVVTPRDELNPIIAYAGHTAFDATETPENTFLHLLRADLRGRLHALEEGLVPPSYRAEARARWESYLEGSGGPIEGSQAVAWDVSHGPFLSSTWGQSTVGGQAVFNYYTPPGPDGDADNYVCGCVATALAQILNHYEWPRTGTGSHSYDWNGHTLSASFGVTTYDWANALDDYSAGSTLAQRQAAGLVSYHAGVAVDMNYSSGGSGAYTPYVANALKSYFRMAGEWVDGTEVDFYDRLYANMVNHRPAELAVRDSEAGAGHAIVADGVQHDTGGTRYYHLNMGWYGTDDAWYDIASGFTTGPYTWDVVSGAVLDVVPTPDMEDPGTTTGDAHFSVTWDVPDQQPASAYELQQAFADQTLGTLTDGAEEGMGGWLVDGYWTASSTYKHAGSYAFHGQVHDGTAWYYPGVMRLQKAVVIDGSTSITYYWGAYAASGQELRLEISTDGVSWAPLRSHTASGFSLTWYAETVPAAELSPYVGKYVSLRLVVDYLGGGVYTGSRPGFYVDAFTVQDAYFGDWTTLLNDAASAPATVTVTQDGSYGYRLRASYCDPSVQPSCTPQWGRWSDVESVTVTGIHNSAATGHWYTSSTWDTGSVPAAVDSAIINAGHTLTVDSDAQCLDLVVESDGELVVPQGVTLDIADDLVNAGTLRQTQDVSGSSDVTFFDATGYGGVTLNAFGNGDLGTTEVTIRGHTDCTSGDPDSSVRRCFDIDPTNHTDRGAKMRLYFSASELGNIPCNQVQIWRWDGSAWQTAGTVTSRECTTEPYYVEVTSVTDFSPFVIDNDAPGDSSPTAVAVAHFSAMPADGAIRLRWETTTEDDMLGFLLYRSEHKAGERTLLSPGLIPARAPGGASYSWSDQGVAPGVTYAYWLDTVDVRGATTVHGPVSAAARHRVYLPVVKRALTETSKTVR